MSESEKKTSLTEQLRRLHLTLDPQAPRHATNAQRRDAIRSLIGGLTGGDDEETTERSAESGAGKRTRTAGSTASRREARGVILPEAAEAKRETRKPAAGKPAARNIDRLVDWLFGGGD